MLARYASHHIHPKKKQKPKKIKKKAQPIGGRNEAARFLTKKILLESVEIFLAKPGGLDLAVK